MKLNEKTFPILAQLMILLYHPRPLFRDIWYLVIKPLPLPKLNLNKLKVS